MKLSVWESNKKSPILMWEDDALRKVYIRFVGTTKPKKNLIIGDSYLYLLSTFVIFKSRLSFIICTISSYVSLYIFDKLYISSRS